MKSAESIVDKILLRLGKSNDSEITTAILAAFKLVFIPFITMSDDKSTQAQKEYAVKRDFLTESVALLGYLGITGAVKNNLTAPVCAKYYKEKADKLSKAGRLDINSDEYNVLCNVDKKALKKEAANAISSKSQALSEKENLNIESLKNIAKKYKGDIQNPTELYLNTRKTISHLCVCALALTFIPFVTNEILSAASKIKDKNIQKNKTNQAPLMPINKYVQNSNFAGVYNNVFSR